MIQKELLSYLRELQQNNNREWFHENKQRYQLVRAGFEQYIARLILELATFDSSVKYVTPKESIFRINRDVRFSQNKSPYKTNMGAFISPGGRKLLKSGYYLHIEPQGSFLAVGLFRPPADRLKAIRQEIYHDPEAFGEVIEDPEFIAQFGGLADDQKLKTAPKGYPKDWEYVDYLRYKNFVVSKPLDEALLTSEDLTENLLTNYEIAYPLHRFLNFAIDQNTPESF
ncbi:MAG: DUF2461 domain-containing protein [Bacteroidales bacterium]